MRLPEAASKGVLSSRDQVDGLLVAVAPAHTTTIAAKRINEGSLASRRKTDGTELTVRKASTTTATALPCSLGNIFCSEKKMKPIAIVQQGQAVGSIAITQTTDKRRFESPERVYQALFFKRLQ